LHIRKHFIRHFLIRIIWLRKCRWLSLKFTLQKLTLRLDIIQHAYFIDDTILILLWFGILFVWFRKLFTEYKSNLLHWVIWRLQNLFFNTCHYLKLMIGKISLNCTSMLFVQFVHAINFLILFLGKFLNENRKCILKLKGLINNIVSFFAESTLEIFKPIWNAILIVFFENFAHFLC